jgi:hypothetical protein
MPPSDPRVWEVHFSGSIAQTLRKIQREAARRGRGQEALDAIREILHKLQHKPMETGEPLYHLQALRLQVRTTVLKPLAVDFAVSEERPHVFLKGVRLLS